MCSKIGLVFFSSLDNILPCVQTIHACNECLLANLKLHPTSDHLVETQSVSMGMERRVVKLSK